MSTPTHSQPSETAKQKRTRARVMFAAKPELADCFVALDSPSRSSSRARCTPLAVLSCATRKQAQQIVRWANLSREQKVEAIKRQFRRSFLCFTMPENEGTLGRGAIAILNLIEGQTK